MVSEYKLITWIENILCGNCKEEEEKKKEKIYNKKNHKKKIAN